MSHWIGWMQTKLGGLLTCSSIFLMMFEKYNIRDERFSDSDLKEVVTKKLNEEKLFIKISLNYEWGNLAYESLVRTIKNIGATYLSCSTSRFFRRANSPFGRARRTNIRH